MYTRTRMGRTHKGRVLRILRILRILRMSYVHKAMQAGDCWKVGAPEKVVAREKSQGSQTAESGPEWCSYGHRREVGLAFGLLETGGVAWHGMPFTRDRVFCKRRGRRRLLHNLQSQNGWDVMCDEGDRGRPF